MMYCDEHEDRFPTSAAKGSIGAQPEDWIWWQLQNDASGQMSMRDPKGSPLAAYLGGFEPRFFRCPLDRDALAREILWKQNMSQEMYTYSYSLNAFSDRGMASFMSADRSRIQFNRLSSVMKPAQKIMLAEEKGSPEDGPGSAVIDDGAWQPLGYPLTMRHAGRANVAFADGHVAVVPREFADLDHPEHFDPAR